MMVVLNQFKNHLRTYCVSGTVSTGYSYMEFGEGTTPAEATDTGIETGFSGNNLSGSVSGVGTGQFKTEVTIQDTDTNFDGKTLREFCVVNATTGGTESNRQNQVGIYMDATRNWDLKYEVTFKLGV